MKPILLKGMLLSFGIAVGLLFAEIFLIIDGRYDSYLSQDLVSSVAIWEPRPNSITTNKHPDLNYKFQIVIDSDGVRNDTELATHKKKVIIGFFGDSFTENKRLEESYTFTSILDAAARPQAHVVNYGVDGYGLDQSYLRYKKYEEHDIRHVVYVFCENDFRNLYETGLTDVTQGAITLRVPRSNYILRLLGHLRLTYLVISNYYQLEEGSKLGKQEKWKERYHDSYADSLDVDFLSDKPTSNTSQLAQKFLLLLNKWKSEVELRGRTFTVLVLPRQIETDIASKLLREFHGRVIYSNTFFGSYDNFAFKKNRHWNEYGNLTAAEFISSNTAFPFHEELKHGIDASVAKTRIDRLYRDQSPIKLKLESPHTSRSSQELYR